MFARLTAEGECGGEPPDLTVRPHQQSPHRLVAPIGPEADLEVGDGGATVAGLDQELLTSPAEQFEAAVELRGERKAANVGHARAALQRNGAVDEDERVARAHGLGQLLLEPVELAHVE